MKILITVYIIFIFLFNTQGQAFQNKEQLKAIAYLNLNLNMQQSVFWMNVKPEPFVKNLKKNIEEPLHLYAGSNTNFCSYAALSFTCISTDPLTYVKFMINLYNNGFADYRSVHFDPSDQIKKTAGLLKFKGELDINGADQILFMSLADRFKGYLNFFNHYYKPGAENSLWPATNYAKFNRMLRKLNNYTVEAIGSDLVRPIFEDISFFLQTKLAENDQVFLYLNNAILYKKSHQKIKFRFPTHYVVLFDLEELDGTIKIIYWDYGFKNQMILPKDVFIDIVFGVTWCKKKNNNETLSIK